MKFNITIVALIAGAMSFTEAIKVGSGKTLDEIKAMYNDPEYGDTWRYTNSPGNHARQDYRYVNDTAWEVDAPDGYKEGAGVSGHWNGY